MSFVDCALLNDVSPLGEGLEALTKLENLGMYFVSCALLNDVSPLVEGLKVCSSLRILCLDFRDCKMLPARFHVGIWTDPFRFIQLSSSWNLGAWCYGFRDLWAQSKQEIYPLKEPTIASVSSFLVVALIMWLVGLTIIVLWLLIGFPGKYLRGACCRLKHPCIDCLADLSSAYYVLIFPLVVVRVCIALLFKIFG